MCTGGRCFSMARTCMGEVCVRSKHALRDEEGVVQRAGRMIGRRVEGLEVVVLGLDFRPLGDLVAHADEDVLDLPLGLGDEMQTSQRRRPAGKGDVDAVALQPVQPTPGSPAPPCAPPELISRALRMRLPTLPTSGLCSAGKLRDAAEKKHEIRLPAQKAHADGLERGEIGGGRDRRASLRYRSSADRDAIPAQGWDRLCLWLLLPSGQS